MATIESRLGLLEAGKPKNPVPKKFRPRMEHIAELIRHKVDGLKLRVGETDPPAPVLPPAPVGFDAWHEDNKRRGDWIELGSMENLISAIRGLDAPQPLQNEAEQPQTDSVMSDDAASQNDASEPAAVVREAKQKKEEPDKLAGFREGGNMELHQALEEYEGTA